MGIDREKIINKVVKELMLDPVKAETHEELVRKTALITINILEDSP